MIIQIVVLGIVMRSALAWPITPLDGYSRTDMHSIMLKCGDVVDLRDPIYTNINVTFEGHDSNGRIPAGCHAKLRVAVVDLELEKYGIRVSGSVDINADNNQGCSSSYLTVADEDDLDDELGSIKSYCNQNAINFTTTEDILVIEFVIGENGASGNGFHLVVAPHYLCGGYLKLEETIKSPDFPEPYPRDINCLWMIQAPKDSHINLSCRTFDLKPRRRKRCLDSLLVRWGARTKTFCGNELEKPEPETIPNDLAILDFRTNKAKNEYIGFSCKLRFIRKTKDLLMAKFFK